MLHISLVGSTNSLQFIKAIEGNPSLKLSGIFDPSFQFDVPKNLRGYPVYYSFAELLKHSQAIAFSSVENTYFPFIERLGKRRYGWRGKIYFRTASQAEGYARRRAERADRFLYNKNGSNVNALTQEVDHANKN